MINWIIYKASFGVTHTNRPGSIHRQYLFCIHVNTSKIFALIVNIGVYRYTASSGRLAISNCFAIAARSK